MINSQISHVKFDGKKIEISSDLRDIFLFLIEIDKEIESFMNFEKKLNIVNDGYRKVLEIVINLSDKLKNNNIDFEYEMSKNDLLSTVKELKNFHLPVRSQCIVLFSNIEVLLCLHIAYQEEVSSKKEIMNFSMGNEKFVKLFFNKYFLTEKNKYFKKNKELFSKVSAKNFRDMRNSLVHFFSLSNHISLIPNESSRKARKVEKLLEKKGKKDLIFISPEDLHRLIKEAFILLIKEWNDDSLNDNKKFKKKISSVRELTAKNGAVIITDKQINI